MGARLICADVADTAFCTIYCPNGKTVGHEDFGRKLRWLDDLASHLERDHDPRRPFVLCGDLNICPGPLDSWNAQLFEGTIFHTDDERSRFRRLVDWGLRDLYRERHPETRGFSWWDYRGGAFHRGQGLRIDFLLGTDPVAERVDRVEIDREYRKKKGGMTASDHAPVIVDIRRDPPA